MRLVLIVIGFVVATFSLFVVVSAVHGIITETDTDIGVLWGLFVCFFITGLFALVLTRRQIIKRRRDKAEKRERMILAVIARQGGRVTPFELAAETKLSYEEARHVLEKLCESGAGEVQLTTSGHPVYVFKGVLAMQQKASAKSPLDI